MTVTREDMVARVHATGRFDLIVIGGGATGAGIALDAASRGLSVALFERGAFGGGTSSRSSKLIHGGLRYLALGQWGLVREALRERAILLANAPAIVRPLEFVLPCYGRVERLKYTFGLKVYDWLAGAALRHPSRGVDNATTHALVPNLVADGLHGAVCYTDAGFDDARLLLCVLDRARALGAVTVNHADVVALSRAPGGAIDGVTVHDLIDDRQIEVGARVVINAGGPYGDLVRRLEHGSSTAHLTPSQGAHVVVPAHFLGGDRALVLPRTPDGRIMFAIPWQGHLLLGTTDTVVRETPATPRALDSEVDEILAVAGRFLTPSPARDDVLSVFAGLRPLAGAPDNAPSARRSREHVLDVSAGGLVSVSGGKWTTYRLIAEQAVDLAVASGGLSAPRSRTRDVELATADTDTPYAVYGAHAGAVAAIATADPALAQPVHAALPYTGAEYVWAARAELAAHVTDALACHTRALFLDAAAARAMAPRVARLMARELGRDETWIAQETAAAEAAAAAFSLTPIRARDRRD